MRVFRSAGYEINEFNDAVKESIEDVHARIATLTPNIADMECGFEGNQIRMTRLEHTLKEQVTQRLGTITP
eukprot:3126345-Pyramimonas_sp.AAC.1